MGFGADGVCAGALWPGVRGERHGMAQLEIDKWSLQGYWVRVSAKAWRWYSMWQGMAWPGVAWLPAWRSMSQALLMGMLLCMA